jgi:hypothetical protein
VGFPCEARVPTTSADADAGDRTWTQERRTCQGHVQTQCPIHTSGRGVPLVIGLSSAVFTSSKKSTVQTKDSSSHQTCDTCMEY